jgi:outer membrane protein OmpA-like peptidoglycan-associated protein
MAKACGKCDPHEICEECPEWIFTLADLIMCMMGLFVLLWVLKPAPDPKTITDVKAAQASEDKWLDTVGEIRKGFGYEANPTSNDPVDKRMIKKKDKQNEGKGGKTDVTPRGSNGPEHEVQSVRPGKHAIVGTRILFAANGADLPADSSHDLDEIVRVIQGHRQIFLVKGHTSVDDLPEGATAEQKMSLSVKRAQVVADYLTGHGVEPEILRVQGCSTFEPVVQRAYTEERRRDNRRVEVEGTDNPVVELQDAPKTTAELTPDFKAKVDTSTADVPVGPIER